MKNTILLAIDWIRAVFRVLQLLPSPPRLVYCSEVHIEHKLQFKPRKKKKERKKKRERELKGNDLPAGTAAPLEVTNCLTLGFGPETNLVKQC